MHTPPRFGFVVEYVEDIATARRFYVEVLGLVVQREHPTFVQFESFALASDAPRDPTIREELYWLVDDAEAAAAGLAGRAEIVLALETTIFGKVFAVRDPDGRPRYLLELSANRPSRSVAGLTD